MIRPSDTVKTHSHRFDVLWTIEYLHIRSIDIVSLTGNQVAHRACISIEQFIHPKLFARRAITKKATN